MDRQAYLEEINRVASGGPYTDDWASLARFTAPPWLRGAKFGIFIHWGLYSVPAFNNEWYPRNMYIQGTPEYEHHVKTYGAHKDFGLKDFIPLFKAEKFDPDEWASLFSEAGARYVVPVAEHHDGFQMYKSALSRWNAAEMGPRRDVVGELLDACGKRGLIRCVSTHRIEHWWFLGHGRDFESDIADPKPGDLYWPSMKEAPHHDIYSDPAPTREFLEDWLLRCCELADLHRPRLIYFDWWVKHSAVKSYLRRFLAYYYNRAREWGVDAAVAYKDDSLPFGAGIPDMERGVFPDAKPFLWQACTSAAWNSWCHTGQNTYKSPTQVIQNLIDVVSKNGTLLLNVGPKADGTVPDEETHILKTVGRWLKANGEAVYGATPWLRASEGAVNTAGGGFSEGGLDYTSEDIRFTANNGKVYAALMACPADGRAVIRSLGGLRGDGQHNFGGVIERVRLLGFEDCPLSWNVDGEGLHAAFSGVKSELPVVLEVTTG